MNINRSIIPNFEDIWREYTNYQTSLKEVENWDVTVENKDLVRVQTDSAFRKGNNIPFKLYKRGCQIDAIKNCRRLTM